MPTSWRDYTGDYLALQGAGLPVYGVSYINTTPILNYLLLFLKYKYQISILSSHTWAPLETASKGHARALLLIAKKQHLLLCRCRLGNLSRRVPSRVVRNLTSWWHRDTVACNKKKKKNTIALSRPTKTRQLAAIDSEDWAVIEQVTWTCQLKAKLE